MLNYVKRKVLKSTKYGVRCSGIGGVKISRLDGLAPLTRCEIQIFEHTLLRTDLPSYIS
jgi:hypothetical protein